MGIEQDVPVRANGQRIYASWFNVIRSLILTTFGQVYVVITDGMAATDVVGEEYNNTLYSSIIYDYEVTRGTTIMANGRFYLQSLNGTWQIVDGGWSSIDGVDHGLTFDVDQTGNLGQLTVESSAGPGTGTLKLKRNRYEVPA